MQDAAGQDEPVPDRMMVSELFPAIKYHAARVGKTAKVKVV